MICDICGGTLVMQPGATAKCDCCGMDYSTESLKAKFALSQSTNKEQMVSGITYNSFKSTNQDVPIIDVVYQEEAHKELSETEKKLAQFFHNATFAERMLDIRNLWRDLGLYEVSELQELNKFINDKAEFERLYGFQCSDIKALVLEWESKYGVEIPDETEENYDMNKLEEKKEYIDLICPGCSDKLSFFKWQVSVGEQFICPYCGNSFTLKEEQILY